MVEIKKVVTLAWRKFIGSEAGTEGMLFLREKTPSIQKGDQYQMIFDAGRVEGYKQAIDTISEILAVKQEEEKNAEND